MAFEGSETERASLALGGFNAGVTSALALVLLLDPPAWVLLVAVAAWLVAFVVGNALLLRRARRRTRAQR